MTPAQAIAALDKQVAAHGQTITVRRGTKDSVAALAAVSGFVRGFKAEDVAPGSAISQKDSKVILSPSGLGAWPAPPPKEGDWCEIDGQFRSIVGGTSIKLADIVVRIELQVKG